MFTHTQTPCLKLLTQIEVKATVGSSYSGAVQLISKAPPRSIAHSNSFFLAWYLSCKPFSHCLVV